MSTCLSNASAGCPPTASDACLLSCSATCLASNALPSGAATVTVAHPGWENISSSCSSVSQLGISTCPFDPPETTVNITMPDRVIRFIADESEVNYYFAVDFSPQLREAFITFYESQFQALQAVPFDSYDQESRVDYLIIRNRIGSGIRREQRAAEQDRKLAPLLSFTPPLIDILEARQKCEFDRLDPKQIAIILNNATAVAQQTQSSVESGELTVSEVDAADVLHDITNLNSILAEFNTFFEGYSPQYDWWVKTPAASFNQTINGLYSAIAAGWAGKNSSPYSSPIAGVPIGRDNLLLELEFEMIPYTPEELLDIGNELYTAAEAEMKKAAAELGFGDDWRAALRQVKEVYVEPGQQPQYIKALIESAAAYVHEHDLVTVPPLAEAAWRMVMLTPDEQKNSPFFLGGPIIKVAYARADMPHDDKLSSMRSNAVHMVKGVVLHEVIPGHRLQLFVGSRSRAYRNSISRAFYVEGWAMYWELVFWDRGDFFIRPEERIGTLFWRMHRAARILFTLQFHLGQLTARQCIDLLVDKVGHERQTAEGEVRRALGGTYPPLYQAAYYLGALQLRALREEVLGQGILTEKEFHDRVLAENQMPIELLRALILGKELTKDYKSQWRFYDNTSSSSVPSSVASSAPSSAPSKRMSVK